MRTTFLKQTVDFYSTISRLSQSTDGPWMFTIAIRKRIRPHGPFKSDVVCPAAASYPSQCCRHRSSDVLTHLTLWLTAKRTLCTALLFLLLTVSESCLKSVDENVTYILACNKYRSSYRVKCYAYTWTFQFGASQVINSDHIDSCTGGGL